MAKTKTKLKFYSGNTSTDPFNLYLGQRFVTFLLVMEDDLFSMHEHIRPVGSSLDIKIIESNENSYLCLLVTTDEDDYLDPEYLNIQSGEETEYELMP
jgi:hypothetical protein